MPLSPEEIVHYYVQWPRDMVEKVDEASSILERVRRFVDFDGTIVGHGCVPRDSLMGKPMEEFLLEEAFVVQTVSHDRAIQFFEERPDFPQPEMIIVPEMILPAEDGSEEVNLGKNFEALGLTGKIIIDDCSDFQIHAPGCEIIVP